MSTAPARSDGGSVGAGAQHGDMGAEASAVRDPDTAPTGRSRVALAAAAGLVLVLAVLPLVGVTVPVVLPGPLSSPGSLQVLGIGLVFAGLAVSYDVVFGYAGLLSFGHAFFFASGVYGTTLLMRGAGLSYVPAALLAVLGTTLVAVLLGAVALRVRGTSFAMVTLAFAEALSLFVLADPLRISGGEEGLAVPGDLVPDLFRGVVNTRNLYWFALAFAVLTFVLARYAVTSLPGRVWEGIRENEDRVELLGLRPFPFKLLAFTFGGALAGAGGTVYLLLVRGANPSSASADFTLALLVMVVLGGAGRLWGAALGGLIYGLLTLRLSALGTSGLLDPLPDWLANVLSEPLFVLGALFVVLMLVAPGGVAGVVGRIRRGLTR